MTTSQTSEGKVTTPVRRTLRAGRFALLLLVWLFSAGPLGAQQRWLRQHTELQLISRPVLNSTYTFQKSVGQFLEEAKAAHPQNRYPVQIQLAVGYPLQADGRVNMTAVGPPFPPRGRFNLTASPLLNHAGLAMVCTGMFYSNGRLYGSVYTWKGGITALESVKRVSLNKCGKPTGELPLVLGNRTKRTLTPRPRFPADESAFDPLQRYGARKEIA
jgi:hypothetical protein